MLMIVSNSRVTDLLLLLVLELEGGLDAATLIQEAPPHVDLQGIDAFQMKRYSQYLGLTLPRRRSGSRSR